MSSKKSNKKTLKKGKSIKSNLNANTTEYITSTTAANIPEFTTTISPSSVGNNDLPTTTSPSSVGNNDFTTTVSTSPVGFNDMQNFKNGSNETAAESREDKAHIMPNQRPEYAQTSIPSLWHDPSYNNIEYSPILEYQNFTIPHEENFNVIGYGPNAGSLACSQRPDHTRPIYSLVDPMQNFDFGEPKEHAPFFLRVDYANPGCLVCPTVGPIQNLDVDGGCPMQNLDNGEGGSMQNVDNGGGGPIQNFNNGGDGPMQNIDNSGGGPMQNIDNDGGVPMQNVDNDGGSPMQNVDNGGSGPMQNIDNSGGGPMQNIDDSGGGPMQNIDNDGGVPMQNVDNGGSGPMQNIDNSGGGPMQNIDNDEGVPMQNVDNDGGSPMQNVDNGGSGPMQNIDNSGGGPMQNIDNSGGGPMQNIDNDEGVPMQNVDNGGSGPMQNIDNSGSGPMQNLNMSGDERTANAMSRLQWHNDNNNNNNNNNNGQPIPVTRRSESNFYLDQEASRLSTDACNMAFSSVDDYIIEESIQNEYTGLNAMATALCRPNNNNLNNNTILKTCDHEKRALKVSLMPKDNINEEIAGLNAIATAVCLLNDNNFNENTNLITCDHEEMAVASSLMPKDHVNKEIERLGSAVDGIKLEYTGSNTTATASCLSNKNDLNDNTSLITCDIKEMAGESSPIAKDNVNEETIDSTVGSVETEYTGSNTTATASSLSNENNLNDNISVITCDNNEMASESSAIAKDDDNEETIDSTVGSMVVEYTVSNTTATVSSLSNENNLNDNISVITCDNNEMASESSAIAKDDDNEETIDSTVGSMEVEYTVSNTTATVSCLSNENNLNDNSSLIACDTKEMAGGSSPITKDNFNEETMDSTVGSIEPEYTGLNTTATALCLSNENKLSDNTSLLTCDNKEMASESSLIARDNVHEVTMDSTVGSIEPEYTVMAASATTSCMPDDNNLKDKTSFISSDHKETVVGSSHKAGNNAIKGTIDSKDTNEDKNLEQICNIDKISVKATATTEHRNHVEEDIQPMINFKIIKKKGRSRIEDVYSNKEHVNIVFIGHVDAGKSTLSGHLMYLTGMVDKRTMDKYEKEAKEKSRDSWYLSWAMDTNQEERDRGKTVETGRGHFETDTKHFTILDAPGHKSFVPNMICGAAQADIAVLVLSARQNEFESGFDKGGQTRDHAMLVKSAGINFLIVLVNKMDDITVRWDENRYNYCRDKTLPFLKKLGYALKDLYFMPVSGQTGEGLKTAVSKSICPWFEGPSFIDYLNMLSPISRKVDSPFVMPVVGKFRDMGTVVMGKIEAGSTYISHPLLLMPNKVTVSVEQIWSDDKEVSYVKAGENVKLRLKGIEEEEISPGFVLCDIKNPVSTTTEFIAQMHILDCKSIITPGYSAVMHMHSIVEVVTVIKIIKSLDPKNHSKVLARNLKFVKLYDEAVMRIQCSGLICLSVFKEFSSLGRFTLRENNKVVAIGVVLKVNI